MKSTSIYHMSSIFISICLGSLIDMKYGGQEEFLWEKVEKEHEM